MSAFEMACGINVYCSGAEDERLPYALEDIARLGYSHIAFGPMDPRSTDIDRLKKILNDTGVRPIAMAGLSPETDVSSLDEDVRAAGLKSLKETVDFARELGADQLNGVSYAVFGDTVAPFSEERVKLSAQTVGEVANYAKSLGIKMTFEVVNRYETSMINTSNQAVDYVRLSDSDNLFVHLDTYHMGIEETDLRGAIAHASEVLGYLELGQSSRASLETGSVDVREAVRAARDSGFRGRFGLEAFTRQLLDPAGGNGLSIWRETYQDSSKIAAEAINIVQATLVETN